MISIQETRRRRHSPPITHSTPPRARRHHGGGGRAGGGHAGGRPAGGCPTPNPSSLNHRSPVPIRSPPAEQAVSTTRSKVISYLPPIQSEPLLEPPKYGHGKCDGAEVRLQRRPGRRLQGRQDGPRKQIRQLEILGGEEKYQPVHIKHVMFSFTMYST